MIKSYQYIQFRDLIEKVIAAKGRFVLFTNPVDDIECNIFTKEGRAYSATGENIYEAVAAANEKWENEKT